LAFILNIETSTKNCSVSVAENGKTIALTEINDGNYSHAEKLHEFIQVTLKKAKISLTDLQAIAVSKGPGSYTGLRIGVSAAKGLCFALDVPLISVNTLTSLAHSISIEKGIKIPMIDARRMEVYSAVFSAKNEQLEDVSATIINEDSFEKYSKNEKVFILGDGAEKCKSILSNNNITFIDGKLPSANEMSKLAYEKYKKNDIEDVAYFEPFYLKEFIALKPKK
jgi:tRNA threonylcarbamoyladenosine biosynthesis protein TsaB